MKRTFLFLFYLLAGIIIGALLANVLVGIPALAWMGYTNTIGFSANNPAVLDLIICKKAMKNYTLTASLDTVVYCCSLQVIHFSSHLQ